MADVNIGNITAQLTLNATQFQQGIQQAIQGLQRFAQAKDQILTNLTRLQTSLTTVSQHFNQFNQVNQQFNQLNNTVNNFNQTFNTTINIFNQAAQAAQGASSSWRTMFQIAGGIGLATTIQGIVSALKNFATESVQLAARMQDLHRSFVALEGSGQAANRTLEFLFQTAQRTGTSFTDLTEGFRRLEAGAKGTTLSSDDLKRAMEGIAAGSRVMGLSSQQSQNALVAWEQILTKGRLAAEELVRQLGNAVPGGLNIVARSLGVTTAQLRAMAETGLIPGTVAFVAFSEEMRKIGQSAGAIDSLSATFVRLKNETVAWMTAIGDAIGKVLQPFLDKIIEISEELRKLFNIRAPGVAAPGTGAATPEGPFTRATQFPIAPSPFTSQIQQAAQRERVDPGLLSQLVRAESNFNPNAVSPSGALGLGQVMPETARELDPNVTRAALMNPETNLRLAAKYLAQQLQRFRQFDDQVKLALTAYNAGPGTVQDALLEASQKGLPQTFANIQPLLERRENREYAGRVLNFPAMQAATEAAAPAQAAEAQQRIADQMTKDIAAAIEQLPLLRAGIEAMSKSLGNVGSVMDRDVAQGAQKVVDKLVELNQGIATLPEVAKLLSPALKEQLADATKQTAVWQQLLQSDTQRRDLLKQQVQDVEQLTMRRQAELVAMRQGQQEAERFTRMETARLAAARLEDRPKMAALTTAQQIAEYEARLTALQARADQFGAELEQRRVDAMRPQLEAQIQSIETFMGRPGRSLAQQASAQVFQQAEQIRAQIEVRLLELARHPALQEFAERLQNALAGLGEAAAAQAEKAFARIDTATTSRISQMGDQIELVGERIGAAGLDPLTQALSRVRREFDAMVAQLQQYSRELDAIAEGGSEEQRAAIALQQERIQALIAARDAGEQRARDTEIASSRARDLQREADISGREYNRLQQLEDQLDQMRQRPGPFGERTLSAREQRELRYDVSSEEGQARVEQLQAQMNAQTRLNYASQVFEQFGGSVGSAWTNALTSIANGTATVSEAFRQMAQSILQSMAQIAAQESFRALFRLGAGLLFGGVTGGLGGGPVAGGGFGGGGLGYDTSIGGADLGGAGLGMGFEAFQHGGVVRRPTMAMIGEGPSHTLPEYVLNRPQMEGMMQSAMRRGPSAGGQAAGGAGIVIVNVATEGQAEQERLKREGLGFQVVVNHVLKELSSGESSKINRAMRNLSR
jgi:tape measure domain-containing protein